MIKKDLSEILRLTGKENHRLMILNIAIGIGWFLSDFVLVYIFQYFLISLEAISITNNAVFLGHEVKPDLINAIWILVLFGVFRMSLQILKIFLNQKIFENISAHLKKLILDSVISNPFEKSSHEVVAMFTEKTSLASQYISQATNALYYLFLTIALFGACLYLCPRETLIVFPIVIILVLPLKLLNRKITFFGDEYVRHQKNIFKNIVNSLRNLTLIAMYDRTRSEFSKGIEHIDGYRNSAISYYFIYSIKASYPYFVGIVSIAITSYLSSTYLQTSPIKLAPFFYIFVRACQNIGELSGSLGEVRKLRGNFQSFSDWLKHLDNPQDVKSDDSLKNLSGKLEITGKNISYKFQTQRKLLSNINLNIRTGECLLIKGKSGSGKTTLLNIILGGIEPTEGYIEVNGNKNVHINKVLSHKLGYVGPENFFFDASIRENLLYLNDAKDLATAEDIDKAIRISNLENEICALEDGIETQLDEKSKMSTGQKQRLSIARALLRKPSILILDEATANLDFLTEREIISSLKSIKDEMIIIVISHKSTFDDFSDELIDLDAQERQGI